MVSLKKIVNASLVNVGMCCFCGKNGCVSNYISGTGLEEMIYNNLKIKVSAEQFLNQSIYSKNEKDILHKFYQF